MCRVYCTFFVFLFMYQVESNPVTNLNFNEQVREYAANEIVGNITEVKTLHKQDVGRYAGLVQSRNPIRLKEVPDNVISSSSHGRGLHHEYSGYGHDYDDGPHYGYDFHGHEEHPHHYDTDHHYPSHHHLGYSHHHKHHDHSLAAKTVLWPLAGLALLGAAAALVTNPVLLQLGVVSGRKRRNTEEESSPEVNEDTLKDWRRDVKRNDRESDSMIDEDDTLNDKLKTDRKGMFKKAVPVSGFLVRKVYKGVTVNAQKHNSENDDDRFIPVQLKTKD